VALTWEIRLLISARAAFRTTPGPAGGPLRARPGPAERVSKAAPDLATSNLEGSAGFNKVVFESHVRFDEVSVGYVARPW
jgi:hypothetical protein